MTFAIEIGTGTGNETVSEMMMEDDTLLETGGARKTTCEEMRAYHAILIDGTEKAAGLTSDPTDAAMKITIEAVVVDMKMGNIHLDIE